MSIDVQRVPGFGWVATIDPAWSGPVVVWEHPVEKVRQATICHTLRWNRTSGSRGIEVEGYMVTPDSHRPWTTPNGEPVEKILHLRRVLYVVPARPMARPES